MQSETNRIHVDFASNADLQKIFAGKKVGDKCEFTVKSQVAEIDEKHFVGSIEKITSDYDGGDEKVAEPSPEAPILISMPVEEKGYG